MVSHNRNSTTLKVAGGLGKYSLSCISVLCFSIALGCGLNSRGNTSSIASGGATGSPSGSGIVSLAINPPNPSIVILTTLQLQANATSANGSSQDVTRFATWTSSNTAAATIQSSGQAIGLAEGLALGSVTITASYKGNNATTTITIVPPSTGASGATIPLTDMTAPNCVNAPMYQTFQGGLYENCSNTVPSDHDAYGKKLATQIQPLDKNGNPSATGKIVVLSIGMSNAADEFGYFVAKRLTNDPAVNAAVVGINGANPNYGPCEMSVAAGSAGSPCDGAASGNGYDYIRDQALTPDGFTESQVQVIWYKFALPFSAQVAPPPTLPDPNANAFQYEGFIGGDLRAMKQRYPKLQMVFISSRIYGGYCPLPCKSPEPYAYEYGFSTKLAIQAQIHQADRGGSADPVAGDLSYASAPWIAWGPYIWANGSHPRSDGLVWCGGSLSPNPPCSGEQDYDPDLLHPNEIGQKKVSDMLWQFFKTSPYTSSWFK